jgi:nitrogen regulatory protein PII
MLKKIECIIQPFKLEEVKEALKKIAVEGMTVTEVKGCGRQRGYTEECAPDAPIRLLPKVKLEIVTEEEKVEEMINTIQSLAKTNKIGAGKIFVIPIEDVLRIRTKERGRIAID